MSYCCTVDRGFDDGCLIVPEGDYLCYKFKTYDEATIDQEAKKFLEYIKKNKVRVVGDLYLKELTVEGFYYDKGESSIMEYQILTK
jgi:effector-binding domain-containing protein